MGEEALRCLITGKPVEGWAADMIERRQIRKDARRETVARALSIPEHHTGWDLLTDAEKDLFYRQADCALTALALGVER